MSSQNDFQPTEEVTYRVKILNKDTARHFLQSCTSSQGGADNQYQKCNFSGVDQMESFDLNSSSDVNNNMRIEKQNNKFTFAVTEES